MPTDEKLHILICDGVDGDSRTLYDLVKVRADDVSQAAIVTSIGEARRRIADGGVTTIFIDPLDMGLSEASDFILGVRRTEPAIAFVLYVDVDRAESDAEQFYRGERAIFRGFPVLDKAKPPVQLAAELDPIVRKCRSELGMAQSREEAVAAVREMAASVPAEEAGAFVERFQTAIGRVLTRAESVPAVRPDTVFLSYRFAETGYVDGLKELLRERGFEVVTGEEANESISAAVLDRIRQSDFFLSLLTRDEQLVDGGWTASAWVLEEKGAALALEKYIVMLVEEGVTGIGGLQGDWQRHHFRPKDFTSAALKAVRQLQSAAGRGST